MFFQRFNIDVFPDCNDLNRNTLRSSSLDIAYHIQNITHKIDTNDEYESSSCFLHTILQFRDIITQSPLSEGSKNCSILNYPKYKWYMD